jgi:heme-degrading monooxygenase HmoA
VFAAVTVSTRERSEDTAEEAVMVGETMVSWLAEIEGFEGFFMLTNDETHEVRVIALWDSAETAMKHREARGRLRERVSATVEVELGETTGFDVPFAWFRAEEG